MLLEDSIYCVDVGSTRQGKGKKSGAFAWCGQRARESLKGTSIEQLVERISSDLAAGRRVALGLEAPLHIPVPLDSDELSAARKGEGNRAWSALAGGYVATLALHQSAWILQRIRKEGLRHRLTLDPEDWTGGKAERILYCWEAFVSGSAHARGKDGNPNLRDAATGLHMFIQRNGRPDGWPGCNDPSVLSMIAAAALWSGWSTDLDLLKRPTAVFRAEQPYS
jgi:hypothetical protein